jgi:hypothetical protein
LQLTDDEAYTLAHSIVDRLLEYQQSLARLPVVQVKSQSQLRASLWESLPAAPGNPPPNVDRVQKEIFSSTNHETHPRFFAFIPGPSNFVGALAEFLRTSYNILASSWLEGSGPAIVELVTLDWIRQLAGYPETAGGIFLSGGSLANLSALVTCECGYGLFDVGFGGTRIDGAEPENGAAAEFGGQDQRECFFLHAKRDSAVQGIEASGVDFFWRPAKGDDCHLSGGGDFPPFG